MKRFVIFDRNEEYAKELAEYLNESIGKKSRRDRFSIHLFTEATALHAYCKEQAVDILLVSEPVSKEEQELFSSICVKKRLYITEYEEEGKVYKYQSAEKILRIVMQTEDDQVSLQEKRETNQIYGVYSPVGRCGKTSFGLALAKVLAEEAPTLFLSLDTFSDLKKILPRQSTMDLSDLMYFALQGKEEIYRQSSKCINEIEGVQYVLPAYGGIAWNELNRTQWEDLFLYFLHATKNQYLVIDFGTGVEKVWELLNLCDCIWMPYIEEDRKLLEFEEFLLHSGREELYDRIRKIYVPKEYCLGQVELRQIFWGKLKSIAAGKRKV